ncbi:MAG TPA: DNRLRE domain-containing protein [Anaerolineales bacterium]|nr:DNRLRE domain-containing protein [Anaerolineales bacterium]
MAHTFRTRFPIRLLILISLLVSLPGGLALAAPGDVTRISVASSGAQGNDMSRWPQVSGDGNFVVFESYATNLVSNDTNGEPDIFVRNRSTGTTERVSVADDESQANSWSESDLAISRDGRFVAFASTASNLVSGDTNGAMDVFVRDRQLGQTKRVSVDSSGAQVPGDETTDYGGLAISGDGRFVVFTSNAAGLVSDDTNGAEDVFVHDMQSGATARISVSSNGDQADNSSVSSDISDDGHLVVFWSSATNLVSGDTNSVNDVFVHDLLTGETTRVSVNSNGEQADHRSDGGALSDDGRYVVFSSEAENLAPGYEIWEHVYLRDLETGETTRMSVETNGNILVGWAQAPDISGDGRYVAFEFDSRDDGAPIRWIYVHDRVTGQSIAATRGEEEEEPFNASLTGNGRFLAFDSGNSTLVSGDTNGVRDVFVREAPFYSDPVPTVVSINRADPNPTFTGRSVHYTVTFSEAVTGVDATDFRLTKSGTTSAAITGVTGTGNTYTVTISTGNTKNTLRLDLIDNDSIKDATNQPLGGPGTGNGNFTTGQAYTVYLLTTVLFRSNGTNDGWVVESGETTNQGGSLNATGTTFYLGDNAQDRQFRAFLHFPTSTLPDNAVIRQATIKLKKQGITGTDPFTTHQNIVIDIRSGAFSGSNALQIIDFQAAASRNAVGMILNTPSGVWYSSNLDATAFPYVNRVGVTQFRLAFQLDDNDDLGADTIKFYSGNYSDLAYRPQLQIQYYVP